VARTSLYGFLSGAVPLRFGEGPLDQYPLFVDTWRNRQSGTIMPPGPSSIAYKFTYEPTDEGLAYETKVFWHPITYEVVRRMYPGQLQHRSRSVAVSYARGQVNELDHRIHQTQTLMPQLKRWAATPRISHELYAMVLEETKKHLRFNKSHIEHYIHEHQKRGLGGGYKWKQAYTLTDAELKSLLQMLFLNLEELEKNEGRYSQTRYYTGIRARSEALPGFSEEYAFQITRSRIITFHPSMSLWTLFIPEKVSFYERILNRTRSIVNARGEIHFPPIEGGMVYKHASELFLSGKKFIADDGKSWDSSVGTLMGPSFTPFWFNVNGIDMLGSGITFTSLFDTMASVLVTRDVTGDMVILGDDINGWGCKGMPQVGFIEFQPDDTRHGFVLGLGFAYDPAVPRTLGLKITTDRGDLSRPIHLSPIRTFETSAEERIFNRKTIVVTTRRSNRMRAISAGLPFGDFAGRSLIDAVSHIRPSEFKAGFTETLEEIAEQADENEELDAYAWAKSQNVANVFG